MAEHIDFKRPASILVVVFTRAGEFLLMQRTAPANFWQSITGSLRPGETPRHAATRELREETGLLAGGALVDLHQSRLFAIRRPWRARYRPGHYFNREHWFALAVPQRRLIRLNPREHCRYLWLDLPGALARASSATNREAMRLLAGIHQGRQ